MNAGIAHAGSYFMQAVISPIHLLLPQRVDGLSVRAVLVIRRGRDAQRKIASAPGLLVTVGADYRHIPHDFGMSATELSRI